MKVNEGSRFKERIDLECRWRSEQIHVNEDIDYSSEARGPVDREPVGRLEAAFFFSFFFFFLSPLFGLKLGKKSGSSTNLCANGRISETVTHQLHSGKTNCQWLCINSQLCHCCWHESLFSFIMSRPYFSTVIFHNSTMTSIFLFLSFWFWGILKSIKNIFQNMLNIHCEFDKNHKRILLLFTYILTCVMKLWKNFFLTFQHSILFYIFNMCNERILF